MPITWRQADISPAQLAQNPELAKFTWEEFSTAYEAYLLRGGYNRRRYNEFYNQNLDKKKRMINLILKVKGKTIKDNVIIPTNVDIALSNIDLVIKEVLKKPTAKIYA